VKTEEENNLVKLILSNWAGLGGATSAVSGQGGEGRKVMGTKGRPGEELSVPTMYFREEWKAGSRVGRALRSRSFCGAPEKREESPRTTNWGT